MKIKGYKEQCNDLLIALSSMKNNNITRKEAIRRIIINLIKHEPELINKWIEEVKK